MRKKRGYPMRTDEIIKKLSENKDVDDALIKRLLETGDADELLFKEADRVRKERYGNKIYIRGLIEFTNHCRNNCYYCGIRAGNEKAQRYRLSGEEILECCAEGYELGYRTFVLQGGEDPFYDDDMMCGIVTDIHKKYPDCAITLSIGEKSRECYERYFRAGAKRYLLRHETANEELYKKLHPAGMSLENRKRCLFDLKDIGYQVGSGFMVGAPYQTADDLISDIRFLQKLSPDMIGIGPYLSHKDTPFAGKKDGSAALTLKLISILRLMFPYALIPSTTALGTAKADGRELGIKAGANVVMPNLSPVRVRKKYELYDNKICTGEESAQCRDCLEKRMQAIGYEIVTDIGDVKR